MKPHDVVNVYHPPPIKLFRAALVFAGLLLGFCILKLVETFVPKRG